MLYPRRVHTLRTVTDVEELAELLTEHTWTFCTGFRLSLDGRCLLFLNDSTSEDGAQEFAVFDQNGDQVESITFGWCDRARGAELIRRTLAGEDEALGTYELLLDLNPQHICSHCR